MNKIIAGWIGGAVGAITVTALHEGLRRVYAGSPRLDKMGEEATAKLIDWVDADKQSGEELYYTSMVGDVVANTAYYSGAAALGKHAILGGTVLGLLAGVGAIELPQKIGLDPSPTNKNPSRKLITLALYTLGGCLSGLIIDRLTKNNSAQ